jgi:Asp-tRNA(Asn)/Glu-tRNA(Gln) amidotransferase A subunit family amidase
MSQSCAGVIAPTRADAWQIAREIVVRVGGDPGFEGIIGPEAAPSAKPPRKLALLQTSGWRKANTQALAAFDAMFSQLTSSGIGVVTRQTSKALDAVETALEESLSLTRAINAWESRWPLNTYARQGATKLSTEMIARLREAEAMSIDDYRAALTRRSRLRTQYAAVADIADACISLSAPDVAPLGIESTGDPVFAVPASCLGVPALSMPLLALQGLPLGVQLIGFNGRDADLFATAAAIEQELSAQLTTQGS